MMKIIQELRFPGFGKMIEEIYSREYTALGKREALQVEQLRGLLKHVFANVPYYKRLSKEHNIEYSDFNRINDLNKLPILTKEQIKSNLNDFIFNDPRAIDARTGGTTGQPLHYKISKESYYRGRALLYNGWNRSGYKRGDKILLFAGGSLVGKNTIKSKIIDKLRNAHSESSFAVTDEKLDDISKWIVENRPEYIRGYASALALLAEWFAKNNYQSSNLKACITTSEPLLDGQRKIIEDAFKVKVFDTYGLNDSGASAYECEEHNGLHLDYDRAIIEVCNSDGELVGEGEEGRIIATDLFNYAFPFIRYDTGDIGKITYENCPCGRTSPRLLKIIGRQADVLEFKTHSINGNFLTVVLGKTHVDMYKITQTTKTDAIIDILYLDGLENREEDISLIEGFFKHNAPEAKVHFNVYTEYADFPRSKNKLKFIVNEMKNDL